LLLEDSVNRAGKAAAADFPRRRFATAPPEGEELGAGE
jgi:hypothetical protein